MPVTAGLALLRIYRHAALTSSLTNGQPQRLPHLRLTVVVVVVMVEANAHRAIVLCLRRCGRGPCVSAAVSLCVCVLARPLANRCVSKQSANSVPVTDFDDAAARLAVVRRRQSSVLREEQEATAAASG